MKPKVVYHASENRNIKIFEPRVGRVRDPNEGPVVFATSDKALASIFIVSTDDSWTKSGFFGDVPFFMCSDRKRFEKSDKGGAIYTLPSKTFKSDPNKGLGKREWISKVPITPITKEEHGSGLTAMLEMGVQVYFVNKETFLIIKKSKDHGNSLIRGLNSVNKLRNINIKAIPKINAD